MALPSPRTRFMISYSLRLVVLLPVPRPILRTGLRNLYGIASIPCSRRPIHGRIWTNSSAISRSETQCVAPVCWWHIHCVAPRETRPVSSRTPQWATQKHPIHYGSGAVFTKPSLAGHLSFLLNPKHPANLSWVLNYVFTKYLSTLLILVPRLTLRKWLNERKLPAHAHNPYVNNCCQDNNAINHW